MLRRLLVCLALGLVTAPAAFAAGPDPGVVLGDRGAVTRDGNTRYTAVSGLGTTTVFATRVRDGSVLRSATLRGGFGVPAVAFDGETGGVSGDGSTLGLADLRTGNGEYPLKRHSSFAVLDVKSLRLRERVELPGHYSFDALSPDGSRLYLIQHVSAQKITRYVVRAYDLARGHL